jgi:hypothetical protein
MGWITFFFDLGAPAETGTVPTPYRPRSSSLTSSADSRPRAFIESDSRLRSAIESDSRLRAPDEDVL